MEEPVELGGGSGGWLRCWLSRFLVNEDFFLPASPVKPVCLLEVLGVGDSTPLCALPS